MPRGAGQNWYRDAASLQGRLWSPAGIADLWWDAADLSTITPGTGVSAWANKGKAGGSASQATGSKQPTLTMGGCNSLPVISFSSASTQWLSAGDIGDLLTDSLCLLVVARITSGTTLCSLVTKTRYASNVGRWFLNRESNCPTASYQASGGTATAAASADSNFDWCLFGLRTVRAASAVAQVWVNAALAGTSSAVADSGASLNTTNRLLIGAYPNSTDTGEQAGYFMNGDIAEILGIYTASPDETGGYLRERAEGYLAWKWGMQGLLPAAHPYRNVPPTIGR